MMYINPNIEHQICSEPIERAHTLPSAFYTQAEWHENDVEHVLKPRWQYAGHRSQLRVSGDVVVVEILGQPIILVRDGEVLRAFYNVCKHRGGPLATQNEHCKMLQCKYHGWTYKLDGSLRGVPKFKYAELFDKKDFGLTQILLKEWEGLLFVCIGSESVPLEKGYQGIAEAISPISLADFQFHSRESYSIACNWKVYADNFLEGYHIPHVHPELCNLLDMDAYKTLVNGWQILQDSPLKDPKSIYTGGDAKAWYYFVYPNTMLNILPGRLQINQIMPVDAGRCTVHFDYYYTAETIARNSDIAAMDRSYSEKVQVEDIDICEHVQRGLASDAYQAGRFSVETELGPYHFQELRKLDYRNALGIKP